MTRKGGSTIKKHHPQLFLSAQAAAGHKRLVPQKRIQRERTPPTQAVREKRMSTTFSATQKVYLEQALVKGDLDTVENRQKVAQTFDSESGTSSQPDSIHNWYRNNKPKKSLIEGGCVCWDWLEDLVIVTGLVRMTKYACEKGLHHCVCF